MAGGGRGRGHRGEPPPPFAKAYSRGYRENWNGARRRGKRHVKSAPSPYPTSEGVGQRGEAGVGAAARGPLPCTSPHRTWSRPKCNTFSLSVELRCFLCCSSGGGGTRGSPGGRRSDGSDRYSSPGGECGAGVPGAWEGRRRPGRRRRRRCGEEGSGQHPGAEARRDFCSRGQRLTLPAAPRERWRRAGGGPGGGCGPAAELALPESRSERRRLPRCSCRRAAGRCRMNGRASRRALGVPGPPPPPSPPPGPCFLLAPGRAPEPRRRPGPGPPLQEGRGAGVSLGQEAVSGEGGGEVTGGG